MDAFDPKISDNQQVAWMTRKWEEAWKHTGVFLAVPQSVTIPLENLGPTVTELPGISRQEPPSGAPSLPPAFVMSVQRPPHNPQDPFSFVVMGDSRGKDISWVVGERMNREFLTFIVDRIVNEIKPQLVIFNGDMATMASSITGHRYLPDWINLIKPITDAGILLYVVKGNHELYTFYGAFRKSYQDEYQAYFSNMQEITSLEGYENLAFSFGFGNSYFVIFDSFFSWKAPWYKISDYHYYGNIGDTQLTWLKQQTKAAAQSGAAHFFSISHAPVFSAEGTPEIPFYMMTQAWKTFTQNDFDLYFGARCACHCLGQGVSKSLVRVCFYHFPTVDVLVGPEIKIKIILRKCLPCLCHHVERYFRGPLGRENGRVGNGKKMCCPRPGGSLGLLFQPCKLVVTDVAVIVVV